MGLKDGDVIEHPLITKSVSRAQKKVEENNFSIRKRLLEYDNVMNQQREIIYKRRRQALDGDRLKSQMFEYLEEFADEVVAKYFQDADIHSIKDEVLRNLIIEVKIEPEDFHKLGEKGISDIIVNTAKEYYNKKESMIGTDLLARLERFVTLTVIDDKWREHLREMDDMKEGIGLRSYGQKDPLLEYKQEAYKLFISMLADIRTQTLSYAFKFYPQEPEEVQTSKVRRKQSRINVIKEDYNSIETSSGDSSQPSIQPVQVGDKVGRNEVCPCGSGKKYKNCHGA